MIHDNTLISEWGFSEDSNDAVDNLAFLQGTEWERKDPSPGFRDDVNKSEVLKDLGDKQ